MEGVVTIPVWLLSVIGAVLLPLVVTPITMIFKGGLVPARFYAEALQRAIEEKVAKEEAIKVARDMIEMNKRLVEKDDVAAQVVEAWREEAQWQRGPRSAGRRYFGGHDPTSPGSD